MTVPQAVRTMAVPAVMSQLIVLVYNLADTFFIGQTNSPFMVAGVSLILPLFNVSLAIGSMFGTGGGALLPKLLAFNRREEGSGPMFSWCWSSAASPPSFPMYSQICFAASVCLGKQASG